MPLKLARFKEDLNEEQYQAVCSTEGYLRVLAGAGTGKTKTLAYRYAYLLTALGMSPKAVLCVTFSNKASREMRSRINKLCGDIALPYVTTFHAFCCDFLREEIHALGLAKNFTVIDVSDVKDILKPVFKALGVSGKDFTLKDAWEYIDGKKTDISYVPIMCAYDSGNILEQYEKSLNLKEKVFWQYIYQCRTSCFLDFDDLIAFALTILRSRKDIREKWQKRFEYIEVDEFQDIDAQQYELISILSAKHKNLFIVGDPDQTIYSFRGANVKYFTDFAAKFPETVTINLFKNYRSQAHILDCAYTLISNNDDPGRKKLQAMRRDIDLSSMAAIAQIQQKEADDLQTADVLKAVFSKQRLPNDFPVEFKIVDDNRKTMLPVIANCPSANAQSEFVVREILNIKELNQHASIAVLYRSKHLSQSIEQALIKYNVPYRVYADIRFMERKEIKDVVAYLRLILNLDDDAAFCRIVNVPRRSFGIVRLERLKNLAVHSHNSLFKELLLRLDDSELNVSSAVKEFVENIASLNKKTLLGPSAELEKVLNIFKYEEILKKEGDAERLESLATLRFLAQDFEKKMGERSNIADFLTHLALSSSKDDDNNGNQVELMTAHNSKGLEFDYVFIVGVNDGIFPSAKSSSLQELQEERRLLYVAMTRAQKQLFICVSGGKNYSGEELKVSRFIEELREDEIFVTGEKLFKSYLNSAVKAVVKHFNAGDKVVNPVLGLGTIEEVNEKSGEYIVYFKSINKSRTLSFNAPLERVETQ